MTASVGWNEVARNLVIEHRTDPPMASRAYALLSVAQHQAVLAANDDRPHPDGAGRVHPSERAAVIAASADVLAALYPDAASLLETTAQDELSELASVERPSDVAAGEAAGHEGAEQVMARAATDGADAVWTGTVPVGPGIWFSTAAVPALPLRPTWASVRPWLMTSGSQFRPPPPPAYGSAEFAAALAEVRHYSDTRTAEQLFIAQYWADGAGTYTPPGHWNAIASELITRYHLSERKAALALALMNMAVMDAGISCWDAKYTYWLLRPSQADPGIIMPLGLPNFPSYSSGHASFSGAASTVLGMLFPSEARELRAMAEEAAMSRVYGGIHYRFDSEAGLAQGRAIGELVVQHGWSGSK